MTFDPVLHCRTNNNLSAEILYHDDVVIFARVAGEFTVQHITYNLKGVPVRYVYRGIYDLINIPFIPKGLRDLHDATDGDSVTWEALLDHLREEDFGVVPLSEITPAARIIFEKWEKTK